jgi:hypothetical protein
MFWVDHICPYGFPDFGHPDFVLVGLLARILTLVLLLQVRIFLVLIGHGELLFLLPPRPNI